MSQRSVLLALLFVSAGFSATSASGQQKLVFTPPAESSFDLPRDKVDERTIKLVSTAYADRIQATADGVIFINVIAPLSARDKAVWPPRRLYAFGHEGKPVAFDLGEVAALRGRIPAGETGWDAGSSSVVFLLKRASTRAEAKSGAAWFVARFDHAGAFQHLSPIAIPSLEPVRVATFDSGELLLQAFDESTQTAKLALLNADGSLKQYVTLPPAPPQEPQHSFAERPTPQPTALGMSMGVRKIVVMPSMVLPATPRAALEVFDVAHRGNTLLLVQAGPKGRVIEVRPDGTARAIPLKIPRNLDLDSAVSSPEHLYLRFRRHGSVDGRGRNAAIYAVNPETGELLSRVELGSTGIWNVVRIHGDLMEITQPMAGDGRDMAIVTTHLKEATLAQAH